MYVTKQIITSQASSRPFTLERGYLIFKGRIVKRKKNCVVCRNPKISPAWPGADGRGQCNILGVLRPLFLTLYSASSQKNAGNSTQTRQWAPGSLACASWKLVICPFQNKTLLRRDQWFHRSKHRPPNHHTAIVLHRPSIQFMGDAALRGRGIERRQQCKLEPFKDEIAQLAICHWDLYRLRISSSSVDSKVRTKCTEEFLLMSGHFLKTITSNK